MSRGTINLTLRSALSRPISAAENDQNETNLRAGIYLSSECPADGGGNGIAHGRIAKANALTTTPGLPNTYPVGEYTEIKNASTLGLPAGVADVVLETFSAASGRVHQRAYTALDTNSPPTLQEFVRLGSGAAWGPWQWVVTSAADPRTLLPGTGTLQFTISLAGPPSGWVAFNDGTIGDAASGANRANADTAALFTMLWAYQNTVAPVFTSGGAVGARGASAALDYAAHKRIQLLTAAGRALVVAGNGAGLTGRGAGSVGGEERHTLSQNELPDEVLNIQTTGTGGLLGSIVSTGPSGTYDGMGVVTPAVTRQLVETTAMGAGDSHNIMQPFFATTVWIKL